MDNKLPSTIGLIAGNGRFPLLFAKAARERGIRVVVAAVRGDTSALIYLAAREVRWFSVGEIEKIFDYFRTKDARQVIMAGQIHPRRLFDEALAANEDFRAIFSPLTDRRCDTILGSIAERLKKEGLELLDPTLLLKDYLAPQGTLTRRAPTEEDLADIEFGAGIARNMGALDIGQTVVVKGKAILAIEAMEGTDQCILRGGRIARSGAVVVKTAKPQQDNRFDVPVVGPRTIQVMAQCRASCLAIEAGKTLMIDPEATVARANKARITIVAV
jgi:DUF1009 family protein